MDINTLDVLVPGKSANSLILNQGLEVIALELTLIVAEMGKAKELGYHLKLYFQEEK